MSTTIHVVCYDNNMAAKKNPSSKQSIPGGRNKSKLKPVDRVDASGNSGFGRTTPPKPYVPNWNVPPGTPWKKNSPYKPKLPNPMPKPSPMPKSAPKPGPTTTAPKPPSKGILKPTDKSSGSSKQKKMNKK